MKRRFVTAYRMSLLSAILFGFFSPAYSAQPKVTLKDIIEKNVQAAGGIEKLSQIQNFSFRAGQSVYYASSDCRLKILTGRDPVITEAVLVDGDQVRRNSFNEISEITGIRKSTYQCLARLYSGLMTLAKFEGQLLFSGQKKYGLEEFYQVESKIDDLRVAFYLRVDDFSLRRVVFQSYAPEGNKYEVNYDFGPGEIKDGLKIPVSWFSSQVGTRGLLYEASDIKFNQPLDEDFFTSLQVNAGTTEAAAGFLKGNVIDFSASQNNLIITTNWTRSSVEKAGFKTKDQLVFMVEGVESDIVFYSSADEVPQTSSARGMQIMGPSPRGGEIYVIYFYLTDFSPITPKLRPLVPIQVKKK